jgi:hypothetical protein
VNELKPEKSVKIYFVKKGGKVEGKSAFLKSLLKITTANQSSIISVRI